MSPFFLYIRRFHFSIFFHFEILFFEIFIFRHFYLSIFFCEIFRHFYHSTFFLSIKLGLAKYLCLSICSISFDCIFDLELEQRYRLMVVGLHNNLFLIILSVQFWQQIFSFRLIYFNKFIEIFIPFIAANSLTISDWSENRIFHMKYCLAIFWFIEIRLRGLSAYVFYNLLECNNQNQ